MFFFSLVWPPDSISIDYLDFKYFSFSLIWLPDSISIYVRPRIERKGNVDCHKDLGRLLFILNPKDVYVAWDVDASLCGTTI